MSHDSIANPNFQLWNPLCRTNGTRAQCRFDVTSPDFLGINKGDPVLISGFLESLDICCGELEHWTVERFASPYFAYDPTASEWTDLFGLAWHITLSITDVSRYRDCGKLGPYPAHGLDSTWFDGQNPTVNEEEKCVIIATEGPGREFTELTNIPASGEMEMLTFKLPHADIIQARVDLGVVNLSDSTAVVREILHRSKVGFMTHHWSDAFERSAWQKTPPWVTTD
ncbi:hypothetical protein [Streptomyces syringium]|uniref:hypothetical protein n=1 Tax=Streptomyces syringium TaxID=76729 RepID=UPI00340B3E2B